MRVTDKHVFFWGNWPSNWYPSPFDKMVDGKVLNFYNAEQYFMFIKALTFKDHETAEKIYNTEDPSLAKQLGRQVKNYDDTVWNKIRYKVMLDANMEKYLQNSFLREKLMNHKYDGKTFVEASPLDIVWGVGLGEHDPLIDDEKNWRGENLLGKIINEVRSNIAIE